LDQRNHWDWATKPNVRELRSCQNILPMQESGQLHFIKDLKAIFLKNQNWVWNFLADGHTENK
jgi:hypothetical protein